MNWDVSRRVGAELHSVVAFNGDYGGYHGLILKIHCISVLSNPRLWPCPGLRYRILFPDCRPLRHRTVIAWTRGGCGAVMGRHLPSRESAPRWIDDHGLERWEAPGAALNS